ncbi:protein of unknown function [Xenorhabdus doucetiae]|uniref:Uncharacterized protein n=1 Tax=Xenorhabdus doucetiae TaxID=351671 RepID=A0A068QS64_9GAMM|nr:protein of unknown function [Xenorhabdus doucetiae]
MEANLTAFRVEIVKIFWIMPACAYVNFYPNPDVHQMSLTNDLIIEI